MITVHKIVSCTIILLILFHINKRIMKRKGLDNRNAYILHTIVSSECHYDGQHGVFGNCILSGIIFYLLIDVLSFLY